MSVATIFSPINLSTLAEGSVKQGLVTLGMFNEKPAKVCWMAGLCWFSRYYFMPLP
jgi:hypothetical protein